MFDNGICPVCGNKAPSDITDRGGYYFECGRCGEYVLTGLYDTHLINLDEIQRAYLSGYIRDNQSYTHRCIIDRRLFFDILNDISHIMPAIKADKVLLTLSEISSIPGSEIEITERSVNHLLLLGKSYIINNEEWIYIIQDLLEKELGYIEFIKYTTVGTPKTTDIKITPKGWKHLSEMRLPNQDSNSAFIAMWFNKEVKSTRDAIKQAILDAGYEPKIVDEEPFNGDVVNQIITFINQAKFVVADLTGQRQGVYFEAGYAKGLNLPVIYSVRDDQIDPPKEKGKPDPLRVHFDLNHQNLISWNDDNLEEDFKKRLTNHITATIGVGPLKKEK